MSRAQEIKAFVTHLRWHYQVLILPAGYLLGGLYQPELNFERFALQFLNVHLLLNGGVTAYNSFWDKDEGPIGGLSRPPPLARNSPLPRARSPSTTPSASPPARARHSPSPAPASTAPADS
jgi:hypothetical protein